MGRGIAGGRREIMGTLMNIKSQWIRKLEGFVSREWN
jgi:hypothetical protein